MIDIYMKRDSSDNLKYLKVISKSEYIISENLNSHWNMIKVAENDIITVCDNGTMEVHTEKSFNEKFRRVGLITKFFN